MSVYATNCKDSDLGPDERRRMEKEIEKLKEMLSIHLDLIQHQADQAASRETQVKALRRENDLLLQKVERMERRLAAPARSTSLLPTPVATSPAPLPTLPPPPPPPPPPEPTPPAPVCVDAATSPRPRPPLSSAHTQTSRAERHGRYTQTVPEEPPPPPPPPPVVRVGAGPARRSGRARSHQSPPPPPPPLQPAPTAAHLVERAAVRSAPLPDRRRRLSHHAESVTAPVERPRRLSHHVESLLEDPPVERPRRLSHHVEPVPEDPPAERPRRLSHHVESVLEDPPADRPRRLSHHVEPVPEDPPADRPCQLSHVESVPEEPGTESVPVRLRRPSHHLEESTDETTEVRSQAARPRRLCHQAEPPPPPPLGDDQDAVCHRTRASSHHHQHQQQQQQGQPSAPACPDRWSVVRPAEDSEQAAAAPTQEKRRLPEVTVSAESRRLQRRLSRKGDDPVRYRKCLLTEREYHQYVPTEEEEWEGEDGPGPAPAAGRHCQIEIPSWCVRPLTPLASPAVGAENLDDAVFNKRHTKHELDEKRRKRWDLQRLREQRAYEKLKQSYVRGRSGRARTGSGGDGGAAGRPLTLRPPAGAALYLQVSPRLPVCAFGSNLPPLAQREFQLPWTPGKAPAASSVGRGEMRARR